MSIKNPKIGVIGGGSWATAIVKILSENTSTINWWVRSSASISHIKKYGRNPKYVSSIKLDVKKLSLTNDINNIVNSSDYLVLAVPSAFLESILSCLSVSLNDKIIISAVKGIIPNKNITVVDFMTRHYNVKNENMMVVSGPCHAEEIALEKLSYLTFGCKNLNEASFIANLFSCNYVRSIVSNDVFACEYSSVLKNIFAIASGICHGLKYGDNFQSVLVANASSEIARFLNKTQEKNIDINKSVYLGDLLVTTYSRFSRNRMFGELIGKGYSVKSAESKLKMIAEGYYSVKCINEINKVYNINMPIVLSVYNILYKNSPAEQEIQNLSKNLS